MFGLFNKKKERNEMELSLEEDLVSSRLKKAFREEALEKKQSQLKKIEFDRSSKGKLLNSLKSFGEQALKKSQTSKAFKKNKPKPKSMSFKI